VSRPGPFRWLPSAGVVLAIVTPLTGDPGHSNLVRAGGLLYPLKRGSKLHRRRASLGLRTLPGASPSGRRPTARPRGGKGRMRTVRNFLAALPPGFLQPS